ncbi:MAG: hypothetical protein WAU33_19015 [Candidatus Binataceae bacterium]
MNWNSKAYSYGRPVTVLQEILRLLQDDLTLNEAERLASGIIETIPHFVADPTEWSWKAGIEWDGSEQARAILLEATKPRHKWFRRIRLPLVRY